MPRPKLADDPGGASLTLRSLERSAPGPRMAGAAGVARHEPWRVTPRTLVMLVVLTLIWGPTWPLFPLAVREVSVWTIRSVSGLAAAL
ncbi:MAG: hypothetical protein WA210_22310, partial [Burkholderiaceae bacterium]